MRRCLVSALLLGLALPAIAAVVAEPPSPAANLREEALLRSRKLMPDALRQLLEQRQSWLLRGFREAGPPAGREEARRELEAAMADQIQLLAGEPLFNDVIAGFGRIARAVCELNAWRRHCDSEADAAFFDDFEPYAERKRRLFVPVFYDYSPHLFVERNPAPYVEAMEYRVRTFTARVADLYRNGGSARSFDDRSPGFGLAAMHFSHTITDIANLWLYCWREARGDLGGVPFFPYPHSIPAQEKTAR
jgi:ribosome modulation factor